MTACLLCESEAVADLLCVPCGAKKWAAVQLLRGSNFVRELLGPVPAYSTRKEREGLWKDRETAMRELSTPESARAFLARLEAARKAREAAPLCSRGCVSHEDGEEGRS